MSHKWVRFIPSNKKLQIPKIILASENPKTIYFKNKIKVKKLSWVTLKINYLNNIVKNFKYGL